VETPALIGEIDNANAELRLGDLMALAQQETGPEFVIDCSQLTYLGSLGLSLLVRLRARVGKHVVLVGMPSNCRRPFEITRLDQIFEFREAVQP
jgi:anti-anti-sigma factor